MARRPPTAMDNLTQLTKATYDPTGTNQITGYIYDAQNRLTEVDEPNRPKVQFACDAEQLKKKGDSMTTPVSDWHVLPLLTLIATCLGMLGSLYLIYDLGRFSISLKKGWRPSGLFSFFVPLL